jgi:hypothetical protein
MQHRRRRGRTLASGRSTPDARRMYAVEESRPPSSRAAAVSRLRPARPRRFGAPGSSQDGGRLRPRTRARKAPHGAGSRAGERPEGDPPRRRPGRLWRPSITRDNARAGRGGGFRRGRGRATVCPRMHILGQTGGPVPIRDHEEEAAAKGRQARAPPWTRQRAAALWKPIYLRSRGSAPGGFGRSPTLLCLRSVISSARRKELPVCPMP